MLILDFSSVIIANLHAMLGVQNAGEVEEDLLRHMILNTIRSIRTKFRKEGEIIIACDSGSWRKGVYPYYKANRAKTKEKSTLNWTHIFECFGRIQNDLKESFPYRVVAVRNAEADDVISTLVDEFGNDLPIGNKEDILIMSPDKDFAQLHRYSNVKQYDPIKKVWITHPDPDQFLREHILKGDVGDGVPNIMSPDDTLVTPGKRQPPMTAKRMEAFLAEVPPEFMAGYERNKILIDLRNTPKSIREQVMAEYRAQGGKGRSQIFNYFIRHRLRNLTESLGDF